MSKPHHRCPGIRPLFVERRPFRTGGRWASLSEEVQNAVFADYEAVDQTPGVTPGRSLEWPELDTTVRMQDGTTSG